MKAATLSFELVPGTVIHGLLDVTAAFLPQKGHIHKGLVVASSLAAQLRFQGPC